MLYFNIDFLEQQGMHPPTYAVSLDEDSRTHTTILTNLFRCGYKVRLRTSDKYM
jgi:hypothetical protein